MEPSHIVIGLGNPGTRYRDTRHNIGFRVLDLLAEREGVSFAASADPGRTSQVASARGGALVLAKPRTYMNRSGRAAARLCRAHDVPPERLLVIYDDADLALGRIRLRPEGGTGGHNGVRSLVEVLGTGGFGRIRLGVRGDGRDARDLADYVLEPFADEEREVAEALARLGADAALAVISDGMELAMNRFNGRSAAVIEEDEREEPEEG